MTSNLRDLWRERQQVGAALDSGSLPEDDPAWGRFPDLDHAIREARPTDPAGLAIQMRLLADEFAAIGQVADEMLALRIATALEKLGQTGRHGNPDSGIEYAQVASGGLATPAPRPPRPAWIDFAGPGARMPISEQFVSQAAALVWTINLWVIAFRAWWLRRRAEPGRQRPAAAGAHSGRAANTAGAPF